MDRVPRRRKDSQAILQSLLAGVVPRAGVEHIAVGREAELAALQQDLDIIREGGAAFRVIVGRYGAGKTFMLQLLRNLAIKQNFVVADAEIDGNHRLTGSKGEGLALYRALLNNLSTRSRPGGNALGALIERWLSGLQSALARDGIEPGSPAFDRQLNGRVHQVLGELETLTHGYDFAEVLNTYTRGHRNDDEDMKRAAMRWLRGEFHSKTEARRALGGQVRVMINDETWYDNIKLIAYFAKQARYRGLLIFIDETVHLSRISHAGARSNNYMRLLSMLNDTLQGNADYLGIYLGATPDALEDPRRGFYNNEALESRLRDSRFSEPDFRDLSGPVVRLDTLSAAELRLLLETVRDIHAWHHKHESRVGASEISAFLRNVQGRVGADSLLTPREVLKDFVSLLNLMRQYRRRDFDSLLGQVEFASGAPPPEAADDLPYADFTL